MKRLLLFLALAVAGSAPVMAGGWSATYSLVTGTVAVTNRQANSVWVPAAVLWKFTAATNSTLTVSRVSQGNTFLLSDRAVTNGTCVVWIPEAQYPFENGDVLQVASTATNGQVQIIRKGD